jgi:hypothetical protein
MEFRGPDNSFVLYCYAIFAFVTHQLDYTDVIIILTRARSAEKELYDKVQKKLEIQRNIMKKNSKKRKDNLDEYDPSSQAPFRYGKSFDKATIGFFHHSANTSGNAKTWHQYAICQFLVHNDFGTSFGAFLHALKLDKDDVKMRSNFDIMMKHYHGSDKKYIKKIVNDRVLVIAQQVSGKITIII